MNPIMARWLHFSVADEKAEMKQQMPKFPKPKKPAGRFLPLMRRE